jgi:transcriptional regulator with XRE-family HTH domain
VTPRAGQRGDCPAWLAQLRTEVRRRIREQNTTQAAIAARTGTSYQHMSDILRGAASGSPELLTRIAWAVGLRIEIVAASVATTEGGKDGA